MFRLTAPLLLVLLSSRSQAQVPWDDCIDCWCIPPLLDASRCPDLDDRTFYDPLVGIQNQPDYLSKMLYFGGHKPIEGGIPTLDPPNCMPYPEMVDTFPQLFVSCNTDQLDSSRENIRHLHSSGSRHRHRHEPVCAFQYFDGTEACSQDPGQGREYELITYSNIDEAHQDGAIVTHMGKCGVCSSAQDLSAIMNPGIDTISKDCSLLLVDSTTGDFDPTRIDQVRQCLLDNASMTAGCAQVWAANALNTGIKCLEGFCSYLVGDNPTVAPPNDEHTCELDPCLLCDEEESGPLFSEYSGRTRRNSGLVLGFPGVKRDCSTIANLPQDPCATAAMDHDADDTGAHSSLTTRRHKSSRIISTSSSSSDSSDSSNSSSSAD